ncbi:MAG: hypothetical protein Q9220_004489 [cf. Caloplaca sp. 1 TL-2023]
MEQEARGEAIADFSIHIDDDSRNRGRKYSLGTSTILPKEGQAWIGGPLNSHSQTVEIVDHHLANSGQPSIYMATLIQLGLPCLLASLPPSLISSSSPLPLDAFAACFHILSRPILPSIATKKRDLVASDVQHRTQ